MLSPTDPNRKKGKAPRATATTQSSNESISGMLDFLKENYGRHSSDSADWTSPCPICQRPYPPTGPHSNTPPSTTTTTTTTTTINPTEELHTTTPSPNPIYCSPPVMTELCRHVFGSACYLRYLLSRLPDRSPLCPTCRDCNEVPVLGVTVAPTATTANNSTAATDATQKQQPAATTKQKQNQQPPAIYGELYLLDYYPIPRWKYPHNASPATLRREAANWISIIKDMRTMEETIGAWRIEAAPEVMKPEEGEESEDGEESDEGEIKDDACPPPKAHYLVVIASASIGPRGHRVRDFGVKPWCGGEVYGRVMRRFLKERDRAEPREGDRWQECEIFGGVLGEVFDVGDARGVGVGSGSG